ncbi:MAG: PorT family protein [Tannerella sp.]|jgi:hypothetical protein|nr:PorT family protein [Tannerella sp.]
MKYGYIAALLFLSIMARAQEDRSESIVQSSKLGWEIEIKAGFKIGGTAPIPLPREIREINSYSPTLSIPFEANITKWLGVNRKWGVTSGLKTEDKSMITKARVKNYSTEIIGDGGERVGGRWTGNVKTNVRTTYVTWPLLAAYRPNRRWTFHAGPYASILIEGEFSGHVYDGYLREDDPTGPKIEFSDGRIAAYDFSRELRRFAWGMQAGASWRAFKHLNVYADLSWGLNELFKSGFNTVTFNMYPIYADFGLGYVF